MEYRSQISAPQGIYEYWANLVILFQLVVFWIGKVGNLLICSKSLTLQSDCEWFAHVAL